jgi:hypothetical protein
MLSGLLTYTATTKRRQIKIRLVCLRPSSDSWCRPDRHCDRKTRPLLEEIVSALQSVLTNYSRVYIVVDALDECLDHDSTRKQLLAKLHDLQGKIDLRLMTTSRFIPDIVEELKGMPMLEVRASDADMKQFVAGQIYRLPKCIRRDHELQSFVERKIVEAVEGMLVFRILFESGSLLIRQVSACSSSRRFPAR